MPTWLGTQTNFILKPFVRILVMRLQICLMSGFLVAMEHTAWSELMESSIWQVMWYVLHLYVMKCVLYDVKFCCEHCSCVRKPDFYRTHICDHHTPNTTATFSAITIEQLVTTKIFRKCVKFLLYYWVCGAPFIPSFQGKVTDWLYNLLRAWISSHLHDKVFKLGYVVMP